MTIRAREAVAAEFLRKALAVEAVGVPELDMMAREAGLLSDVSASQTPSHSGGQKSCSEYDPSATASGHAADGFGNCRSVQMCRRQFRPDRSVPPRRAGRSASGSRE
jgi:hypothetical protein